VIIITTRSGKKGDKVKVKSGKNYIYGTNNKFTMFVSVYTVLEINGDRVVISSDGKNVTTAINKNNLEKA
jgi:type II secretory pathway component PulC